MFLVRKAFCCWAWNATLTIFYPKVEPWLNVATVFYFWFRKIQDLFCCCCLRSSNYWKYFGEICVSILVYTFVLNFFYKTIFRFLIIVHCGVAAWLPRSSSIHYLHSDHPYITSAIFGLFLTYPPYVSINSKVEKI